MAKNITEAIYILRSSSDQSDYGLMTNLLNYFGIDPNAEFNGSSTQTKDDDSTETKDTNLRGIMINDLAPGESGYIPTTQVTTVPDTTTIRELLNSFIPLGPFTQYEHKQIIIQRHTGEVKNNENDSEPPF